VTDFEPPPLTRARVEAYLTAHPGMADRREIAQALGVRGSERRELRAILRELEDEGRLTRTAAKTYAPSESPPPVAVVAFETVDEDGDLLGRVMRRDGLGGPTIRLPLTTGRRARGAALGRGDQALCKIEYVDGDWIARPIRKLEAVSAPRIVGIYRRGTYGGRVIPASKKEKDELLVDFADANDAEDGALVACELHPGRGYGPKRARVTEIFGHASAPNAASLLAIASHDVPMGFSEAVLREAETARPAEVARTDLTALPLVTIDPEDARDHDDAVFAEHDPDAANADGWRVVVAIADVSAYVTTGSELDRAAYLRGNSTYFPDRVAPMLPEVLSTDRCSLKDGQDRPCLAVDMRFDANGRKLRHTFIRGRMRSAGFLTYGAAQAAINGNPDAQTAPLLEPVLRPLWAAWRALDRARKAREPLELELPERKVMIGPDGQVLGIRLRERFDAHRLIEEFMIQANVCAAETLEQRGRPLLYRVHEPPSDEKINALSAFLPTVGLKWAKGQTPTPARFNRVLDQARELGQEGLVSEVILRSQSQARYAPDALGHFGLNLHKYAHFTSPIRRYADLVVHRALIRALGLGPDGQTDAEASRLEVIGEHITATERRSMAAEREATDRYLASFLADRVGAEFAGKVAGLAGFGLFVKLDETGADGLVPAARLGGGYWYHEEAAACLVNERSRERYRLGQPVLVRLVEAVPVTGGLLFDMLSEPMPPGEDDRGSRGPRQGQRGRPTGFIPQRYRSGGPPGRAPGRAPRKR
jgi:ribonuclease R